MRVALALAVFALVGLAPRRLMFGQTADATFKWAVTASGYSFYPDIVYQRASGQDIKLDVIAIEPLSQLRPTLLYIHGGGWVNGKKGNTTLAALPFLEKGMAVVNIDYRLADDSLAPAAVEDCRCALRWVYSHAKEYGFDTNKVVIAGESAGGHLALTTGMLNARAGFDNLCATEGDDTPLKAAAIISYSGPTDVADLLESHPRWFALRWLGSLPNRQDLARRLSPLSYVHSGLPPIILVHGDSDPYVPYSQSVQLHEALDHAAVPNQLITLHGPIHGWAIEKELKVEEQVFELLGKYGILTH